jgi:hypothetical protein
LNRVEVRGGGELSSFAKSGYTTWYNQAGETRGEFRGWQKVAEPLEARGYLRVVLCDFSRIFTCNVALLSQYQVSQLLAL